MVIIRQEKSGPGVAPFDFKGAGFDFYLGAVCGF
jgi:hypothetical protein